MAATLRLPLEVGARGALRTYVQDSPAELAQSVRLLLSTRLGERGALPDYGVVDQVGTTSVSGADIAQAIADWEPRVQEPTITTLAMQLADGIPLSTITVIV